MKNLQKFTKTVIRDLIDQLNHFHQYRDFESLHEIRVNIKRMKAILNAVSFYNEKFKAHRAYLPFRDVFRKAGAIREPEVLNKLLHEYPISKGNDAQKRKVIKAFVDAVPDFVSSILHQWKKNESFISKVSKKKLKAYLNLMVRKVQKELSPKLKMKNIHKTRKAIKEIVYLSRVTRSLSRGDKTFYSEMEEAIGQWHDKQILLEKLTELNGQANKTKLDQLKSAKRADKKRITELVAAYY